MPCLDCLEKRAKVMNLIGLGRWAPKVGDIAAPAIAKVADVDLSAAVSEVAGPAEVREQFAIYLAHSHGVTAATMVHAAAQLIGFALQQACADRACADEQMDAVCETLRHNMKPKYGDDGKRREVVMAKAIF